MPRTRRFVKKAPIIESSSSSSEEDIPVKKTKLSPAQENNTQLGKVIKTDDSSSSESDIENYLQPINKLDFSTSFFNLKKDQDFSQIEKNIFDSVTVSNLSDSESDADEPKPYALDFEKQQKKDEIVEMIDAPKLNFQQLEEFTKTIEEAKLQVEKYNAKKKIKEKNIDVSNILAAGESKQLTLENICAEDLHSSDFQTTDDEDWEEVKIKDQEEKPIVSNKNIEIRIGEMPDHCKKKKGFDLLAAMKRRLNRIRKENQIYVHKVHLLCWIAHGNFVNTVINDSEILGSALSLLPSDKCYPADRIDLSYLEQIVQWYKKTIRLPEKKGPSQQLTLINALKLQIKNKEVYDKKMFVLIFVAILRSLGVQCRMVLSFQVEPLRPPASDLHSLSAKETSKKGSTSKSGQLNKSRHEKLTSNKIKSQNNSTADISLRASSISLQKKVKENKNLCIQSSVTQKKKDNVKLKKVGSNDIEKLNCVKKDNQKLPKNTEKEKRGSENKPRSTSKKVQKNSTVEIKINSENSNKNSKAATVRKDNSASIKNTSADKTSAKQGDTISTRTVNKNKSSEQNIKNKDLKTKDELSVGEDKKLRSKSASSDKKNQDVRTTRSKSTSSVIKVKLPSGRGNKKLKEIPQLDGANDEKQKKNSKSEKPNLKILKNKMAEKVCPIKTHRKRLKSSFRNDDSESEFSSSPTKKSPGNKLNFSRLRQSASTSAFDRKLDIKNDIIGLIKGRIAEQKHTDRTRMVKKRKPQTIDSNSDSDYMPEPIKKKHHDSDSEIEYFIPKLKVKKRVSVKRSAPGQPILSDSDDEAAKKKKKGINVWIEVFLESEEKWITADVIRGQVHCVNELYMRAIHPVSYVVAWNNDHTIKDVTRRYCKNYNTVTRKLRINAKWWEESIRPFLEKNTARSKEEDNDLNRQQLDQPLPTAISEYKNHPLYALRRHLLKFEEIYPPDVVPLGYVRSEPVYPRNCVYVCRSREIWVKEARVVKPGEKPYKVVKARPKYDRLSNSVITDQLLEIFGEWQTTDYEPPTAENGVVPRNAFGNVELFKTCMLPKKTAHLKLPGLNKVCKKLNIDCASAIVGFDFHGGWSHPVYDGFVVCEEFADIVVAAWDVEQQEIEKKEIEKIEKRVYTNWKKLIKGLLIRERLKARYDFGGETSGGGKTKQTSEISKGPRSAPKKLDSDSESDSN